MKTSSATFLTSVCIFPSVVELQITTAALSILLKKKREEAGEKKKEINNSQLDPETIPPAKSDQECVLSGGQKAA